MKTETLHKDEIDEMDHELTVEVTRIFRQRHYSRRRIKHFGIGLTDVDDDKYYE